MQFTEVSEEEIGQMQFSGSRSRGGKNPYGDLLEAVKNGKKVKVPLEAGKQMKNLKWGLSQAAKKADIKLDIKVLADQTGVVVSVVPDQATATSGEDSAEAPTAGTRTRK